MKVENIIIQVKIIPKPKEFRRGCPDPATVVSVSYVCDSAVYTCTHIATQKTQMF